MENNNQTSHQKKIINSGLYFSYIGNKLQGVNHNEIKKTYNNNFNRDDAQLEELYQAFDIKTGDGRYVPENERVKIW